MKKKIIQISQTLYTTFFFCMGVTNEELAALQEEEDVMLQRLLQYYSTVKVFSWFRLGEQIIFYFSFGKWLDGNLWPKETTWATIFFHIVRQLRLLLWWVFPNSFPNIETQ